MSHMNSDVLILYHESDREKCEEVLSVLENSRFKTYFSARDARFGKTHLKFLEETFSICKKVVVVASLDFIRDNECRADVGIYLEDHMKTNQDCKVVILQIEQIDYDHYKGKQLSLLWRLKDTTIDIGSQKWKKDLIHHLLDGVDTIPYRILNPTFLSPVYKSDFTFFAQTAVISNNCDVVFPCVQVKIECPVNSEFSIQVFYPGDEDDIITSDSKLAKLTKKVQTVLYLSVQSEQVSFEANVLCQNTKIKNKKSEIQYSSSSCTFGNQWEDITHTSREVYDENGLLNFTIQKCGVYAVCYANTDVGGSTLEKDLISCTLNEHSEKYSNNIRLCRVSWPSKSGIRNHLPLSLEVLIPINKPLLVNVAEVLIKTMHTVIYATVWVFWKKRNVLCMPIEFRLGVCGVHHIELPNIKKEWHGLVMYFEDCERQIKIGELKFGKVPNSNPNLDGSQTRVMMACNTVQEATLELNGIDSHANPKPSIQVTTGAKKESVAELHARLTHHQQEVERERAKVVVQKYFNSSVDNACKTSTHRWLQDYRHHVSPESKFFGHAVSEEIDQMLLDENNGCKMSNQTTQPRTKRKLQYRTSSGELPVCGKKVIFP